MSSAILSDAARHDVRRAAEWIARKNPHAARALRHTIAKAAATIGEHPYSGSIRDEIVDAPYRCFPLTGFPYVIVHHAECRPPIIARILHAARDLPEVLRDL